MGIDESMGFLAFVHLGIALPGVIVILSVHWWIERRVRRLHPTTFKALGGTAFTPEWRATRQWFRFLHSREYEVLGDTKLASVCNLLRLFELTFLALWAVLFTTAWYFYFRSVLKA